MKVLMVLLWWISGREIRRHWEAEDNFEEIVYGG